MWELLSDAYQPIVLGDKGYIGDTFAQELKTEKGITLLALKRNNSKKPYQVSASIGYCSAPMSENPDIDKLISEADISMYITKAAKKKRLVGLK